MKTIGIAIDKWKLPIFDRHLTEAGYVYEQVPVPGTETLFLKVKAETIAALQRVVESAQKECRNAGP